MMWALGRRSLPSSSPLWGQRAQRQRLAQLHLPLHSLVRLCEINPFSDPLVAFEPLVVHTRHVKLEDVKYRLVARHGDDKASNCAVHAGWVTESAGNKQSKRESGGGDAG